MIQIALIIGMALCGLTGRLKCCSMLSLVDHNRGKRLL